MNNGETQLINIFLFLPFSFSFLFYLSKKAKKNFNTMWFISCEYVTKIYFVAVGWLNKKEKKKIACLF